MKISVRSTVDLLIVGGSVAGVELAIREKKNGSAVLLATPYSYFGDDLCSSMAFRSVPEFLRQNGVGENPTPMTVKQTLDRLMIRNGVPFVFQTFLLGLSGDCAVLADRAEVYAVRARAIVDTTPLLTAARQSRMPFAPFVPGPTTAVCRALVPCDEKEADYFCEERPYRIRKTETEVELKGLDPESYFCAEIAARLKTWSKTHVYTADRVEFAAIPQPAGPDPEGRVFTVEQYQAPLCQRGDLATAPVVDYEPAAVAAFDIAVIGGGTGGASAGVPGARAGLKTLVLERLSHLGGISTSGSIAAYWFGLKIGHTRKIDDLVAAGSAAPPVMRPGHGMSWEVAVKENVLERINQEAGVSVWFDSVCCGAEMADGKITGLLAATPFGGIRVKARQFIDCTGNADLAYRLGAPTEFADAAEPAVQGAGMSPVVPGHSCFNTDYMFTVDSDPRDAERAFLTGRARMTGRFDLSQIPGTRERRRIIGETVLRAADFYASKHYPDTIAIACSNFDTHGFTVDPLFLFHPADDDPFIAEIPFRALLSPGIENLLTTGLGISAQRDAMPLIRMIADVQNQGYAAGLAAAQAVLNGKTLRTLDLGSVQKMLRDAGFLTPDREIPATSLNHDAAIFAASDLPALEKEYREQPDFEKAMRLAFLGSAIGAECLKEKVKTGPWDDGWDYKGMGQRSRDAGRIDAAIMALSGCCSGADFLLPRLREMTPESQFSHYRAVCLYLLKHPAKEAAPELNRLLHGFFCHAVPDKQGLLETRYTDICDVKERNFQLRELYLAGALHACDPDNELAQYFLEQYRKGQHRLYAIYAEKWS